MKTSLERSREYERYLGPHFGHLAPEGALRKLDLLVDEDARPDQVVLDPPHLAAAHVLVLERQLHRVQRHRRRIDLSVATWYV